MIKAGHRRIHNVATTSGEQDTAVTSTKDNMLHINTLQRTERDSNPRNAFTFTRFPGFAFIRVLCVCARQIWGYVYVSALSALGCIYSIGGALKRSLTVSSAIGALSRCARLIDTNRALAHLFLRSVFTAGSVKVWA